MSYTKKDFKIVTPKETPIQLLDFSISEQLNDLINDRRSFITDDKETSQIFENDIKAIKYLIEENKKYKEVFNKVKDRLEYIIDYLEKKDMFHNYESELLDMLKEVE